MNFFNDPQKIENDVEEQVKVERAKMKAYRQSTEIELERLKDEERLQPRIDEIDKLKMNIQAKKALQKQAWTYRLSANILSTISALMTISGIAGTRNLFALTDAFRGKTGIFAIATALLQLIVINLNKYSHEIKKNHFADYKGVAAFKSIVIGVSMVGNFRYMSEIMPNSLFYKIVSLSVAISLDFGSMWISNLSTNVQYRNYTNNVVGAKADNKTRLEKFLYLATEFCFGWIDRMYDAKIATQSSIQQIGLITNKQEISGYSQTSEKSLADVAKELIA